MLTTPVQRAGSPTATPNARNPPVVHVMGGNQGPIHLGGGGNLNSVRASVDDRAEIEEQGSLEEAVRTEMEHRQANAPSPHPRPYPICPMVDYTSLRFTLVCASIAVALDQRLSRTRSQTSDAASFQSEQRSKAIDEKAAGVTIPACIKAETGVGGS